MRILGTTGERQELPASLCMQRGTFDICGGYSPYSSMAKKTLGIKGTVSCMQMTIYNAHTELSNCFDGKIPTRALSPEIGLVLLLPYQLSVNASLENI